MSSTIRLLVNDQLYFDHAPISTITFFEGTLPRELITARVQAVLTANPWLAGRLQGKSQLVVPGDARLNDHLSFVKNEALRPDQSLAAIEAVVSPLLAPCGDAAADEPLWRVTVVEAAAARFALVISLSHMLADGYTYYAIYGQLGTDGDDALASLEARRYDDFGMMLNCATAKRANEWPRQPQRGSTEGPQPRGVWLLNAKWLAAAKHRAIAEAGGGVEFVSTNDVVCSWLFRGGAYDVGIVSSNLRGRMSGLKPAHAGNYEAGLQLDRTDFETPAAMRRAVGQLAIPRLTAGPPLDGYAYARAIVTTSTSHFRPLVLPGCTQTLHLPIKILPPGGPDTFILFRPSPGELGVLQANPTTHFSPAAGCGDAAGPVARPLLAGDAAAAAGPPPSAPPSAPGTDQGAPPPPPAAAKPLMAGAAAWFKRVVLPAPKNRDPGPHSSEPPSVPGADRGADEGASPPPCAAARVCAPEIVEKAYSDAAEEGELATANLKLFSEIALPAEHHGGRPVRAPPEVCARVHRALLKGFERAERLGEPGGLHLESGGEARVFWGFDGYKAVQASLEPREQRKVTTMLPVSGRDGGRWKRLLSGVDGLDELFALALEAARGLAMLSCFVLRQDSAQARFVWHQDNNFPHVKLTIVYLLTPGVSTMRVAGFDSFVYDGQGCGVAFPSAAHHRSGGCTHPGTMKVTFFFGDDVVDPEVLFYTRQVKRTDGGGNVTGAEMWRDRCWDR